MDILLRVAGAVLIAISILDVFLTVLYARSNAGLLAPAFSKAIWRLFHSLSRPLGKRNVHLLSFAGPTNLVLLAAAWFFLLVLGFALVYWPELGTGLQKSSGSTPTDFLAAFYFSGFCLTTLGIGDISPASGGIRLLTVIEAALGFSFFTLTLTYFLSVYSALQRRNTLASILHHKTSGSGDARTFLSSGGGEGWMIAASQDFSDLAGRAADLVESHSFYPVLHYFHFRQQRYGMPRLAFLLMDAASLAKTLPLPNREVLHSSAAQMETATRDLLERLAKAFLDPDRIRECEAGPAEIAAWRRHFREAVRGEAAGGDKNLPSGADADEECYVALRRGWHPYIAAVADFMGYDLAGIVPPPERP